MSQKHSPPVDCCAQSACELEKLQVRQAKTLKAVLAINGVMFLVEITAGLAAASTALLGDSLDMLGDALAYGFSLYVVTRSGAWKAVSALIKGGIMALFGLFVFGHAVFKFISPATPHFETIGLVGMLALAANALCLWLLWHHRAEDINMHSVWLCSRNDIIANLSVLVAAGAVWRLDSQWPDLIVGVGIALLFLQSSFHVLRTAMATYSAHSNSQQN